MQKLTSRILLTRDEQAVLEAVGNRFRDSGTPQILTQRHLKPLCEDLVRYGRLARVKRGKRIAYAPRFYISPKRDFPKSYSTHGFLIDGKWVNSGFVVTDGFVNIMPGAIWFQTVAEAMRGLKSLIDCKFDENEFWKMQRGKKIAMSHEIYARGKTSSRIIGILDHG